MLRFIGIASLAALLLAACGEDGREPSFISEAVAAPVSTGPDYGWRTDAPQAGDVVDVKEYY